MRTLVTIIVTAVVLCPLTASAIDVSGDQWGTWTRDNSPYNVVGEIRVPPESTLVIEPGVVVDFQGHYKFIIDSLATLLAVGTETDSIYFTTADPVTGWHGIRFCHAHSNSQISYCGIEYGRATGSEQDQNGGGIYCYDSSPTISRNSISRNSAADSGGGIHCGLYSDPAIAENTISGNSAERGGGIHCYLYCSPTISGNTISENSTVRAGGAILCDYGSSPLISDNTISDNSAGWGGGAIYGWTSAAIISNNSITGNSASWDGGGICFSLSNPTITNNSISSNTARQGGGGIYLLDNPPPTTISNNTISRNSANRGGGIYCMDHSFPTIMNNLIHDNVATVDGGGIYCRYASSPNIRYNIISTNSVGNYGGGIHCHGSSPTIRYNIISGNSAGDYGGGIYCRYHSSPTTSNNTIAANSAADGGALYCWDYCNPTVTNTILWGDTTSNGSEIHVRHASDPIVTYCDVQGGWPGTGNIDADPIFAGPYNEDFHLRWRSPCIDAGDPDPLYNDPDGTRNDMGAFYFNQDVDGIVELYPHDSLIVIPPEGGDIIYDGWVFNFFGHAGRVDIWTYAFVPEMGQYGPLSLYENVRIPADSLGRNGITEHVPGIAPEGEYVFVAYVGEHPSTIIDSSCFYFTKTGSVAGGIADWQTLKGWFDGGLASTGSGLPTHYALSQNYPNPFNALTVIKYQLPVDGHVKLEVYNTLGQKVATVVDERQEAGYRSVSWDASEVSSGLYFYKLTAGDFTETRRMTLLK